MALYMKELIIFAAIFWTVMQLGTVVIRLILYNINRDKFHLTFAIASLIMSSWGISLLGFNNPAIVFINGVLTPILASLTLFLATYQMIKYFTKK